MYHYGHVLKLKKMPCVQKQITASGVTLAKWAPWRAPDDGMLIVTKNFSLDFK